MGSRKRDANSDDLNRLLARLDPDPEIAWQKYDELRQKLVAYFEGFGYHAECNELADEVLDRISKKPDDYQIDDLPILALGIARNIRKEVSRKQTRTVHLETADAWPLNEPGPENKIIHKIDEDRRVQCFIKCMQGLTRDERKMLLAYYPDEHCKVEELRSRLAEELEISKGTLAKRAARLRSELESCCAKCLGHENRRQD